MAKDAELTPMMQQYRNVKAELPDDVLLLFRMGDFYELFFDDAVRGAEIMGITLTKRAAVPMAGIPYHALENYMPKILEQGVKVAIAEQVEDPKEAKGLVKREVTQIITPGTILNSAVLDADRSNFLVSIVVDKKGQIGIAGLDISTGDFRITQVDSTDLLESELHRLAPSECLISESLNRVWQGEGYPDTARRVTWTESEDWIFDESVALDLLQRHFDVSSLDGFGCREYPVAIRAAGAIMHYAQNNLKRNADNVMSIRPYSSQNHMTVDRVSQRNLELVEPLFAGNKKATLLSVIDKTSTPMGGRLIREWILRPLLNKDEIDARLDAVSVFVDDHMLMVELREALAAVRDIERTISRVNVGSANARDMLVLQRGLNAIPDVKTIIQSADTDSDLLSNILIQLKELPELCDLIERSIEDEPPMTIKDGGIIKKGYHDYLDELLSAATEGKGWIAQIQATEQEKTGIKTLKVRYNKVFGYYIEVSRGQSDNVPETYIRKQTLVNAERFITPELKEIEDKVLGSEEKSKAMQYELFQEIRTQVVAKTADIQDIAKGIAQLDTILSLADVAVQYGYVRPTIHAGQEIDIRDGRHPVVDALLVDQRFVPNDIRLDDVENNLILLTGPNMAGKSTYIRQVALLTLLAQMGSYVPASSATIGLVDRIFTRVGAADDLSRGQSTFMVEMLETANILNNATSRSLIILDEIGRGTSTFDGLSLAWAIAEYVSNQIKARTLFATHYHELTDLARIQYGTQNYNVTVKERGGSVVFLHKIAPGTADKSYGIHVAKLAGLPKEVLKRANAVLEKLEEKSGDIKTKAHAAKKGRIIEDLGSQLSLFDE
jgi:DNA mismatch repair protein MutS